MEVEEIWSEATVILQSGADGLKCMDEIVRTCGLIGCMRWRKGKGQRWLAGFSVEHVGHGRASYWNMTGYNVCGHVYAQGHVYVGVISYYHRPGTTLKNGNNKMEIRQLIFHQIHKHFKVIGENPGIFRKWWQHSFSITHCSFLDHSLIVCQHTEFSVSASFI